MRKAATSLAPILSLGAVLAIPYGAPPASLSGGTTVVNVQVIGLRNDQGVMKAALFNTASKWNADKQNNGSGALQRQESAISSGTASFNFSGVPYGTYALKGFHDEDRSGKFYTGMFGIPKVEVVFSNNVPIRGGAASFAKASFEVNQPYVSLVLRAQRI